MTIKSSFAIGDLASESGVKAVTIRYYESIGLMPRAARSSGNYRRYGQDSRRRLRFIRRCRELGFTLEQVRDLLRLSSEGMKECAEVKRIAVQHQTAVAEKLRDLQRLSSELRRVAACCDGKGVIANCRIIEALSSDRVS